MRGDWQTQFTIQPADRARGENCFKKRNLFLQAKQLHAFWMPDGREIKRLWTAPPQGAQVISSFVQVLYVHMGTYPCSKT